MSYSDVVGPAARVLHTTPRGSLQFWVLRSKLYLLAIAITLAYFGIGYFTSKDRVWAEVNLPLSAASVLVLCVSVSESYIFVRRVREHLREVAATRAREIELQQRLAYQRQSLLSQLTGALIDRLDASRMPRDVLEKIQQLFEADAVAVWISETPGGRRLLLQGVNGLNAHQPQELQTAPWTLPEFESGENAAQRIATDPPRELSPELAAFAAQERFATAVLTPIVRRRELAGVIGVFYRQPIHVSETLAAEMKVLANVIASTLQAEELYHDLVQAQKTESIGTLTSGIAHDFNNVLAAILACASYVRQQTPSTDPRYRYLDAIETSAHRGAALTKQLLAFARREVPRRAVINPNTAIEQTLQLLERSFDKSIKIHRQFAPSIRLVEMDPSQLEQITLNLAVNARDAMPNGGTFTVSTANVSFRPDTPRPPGLELPDGDYVLLVFSDTGHGMDEVTQKRIFEPFFTTKRPGKGTGLGLSLVLSIVRNVNGAIRVESAPGRGTRFEVYLPATTKPLPRAETIPETQTRRGTECILLVEDEDILREMAQLALESQGYTVLAAPDGAAALGIYRRHWPNIALVIADTSLPQMSGPQLLAQLKSINPDLRVIVSSGYSQELEGQRMLEHGCLGYLQKPYSADTLLRVVRQVLDSGL
ncbi:MAG: ATP-binding protein [Verrucomicrobiae bacterium]|nr:ATP-binding protein [Verrucomicrobiae bacterium]